MSDHDAEDGRLLSDSPSPAISPELVLVDPELAAFARELLPRVELDVPRAVAIEPPAKRSDRPPRSRPRRRARRIGLRALVGVAAAAGVGAVLMTIPYAGYGSLPAGDTVEDSGPVQAASQLRGGRIDLAEPNLRTAKKAPVAARPHRSHPARKPIAGRTFAVPGDHRTASDTTTRDAAPLAVPRSKNARSATGRAQTSPALPPAAPRSTPATGSRPLLHWQSSPATPFFDVVLWRDGHRLLDSWPTEPSLRIPPRWSYRGHAYRLDPGTYLWFVYPGVGPRSTGRFGPLLASGRFTITTPART